VEDPHRGLRSRRALPLAGSAAHSRAQGEVTRTPPRGRGDHQDRAVRLQICATRSSPSGRDPVTGLGGKPPAQTVARRRARSRGYPREAPATNNTAASYRDGERFCCASLSLWWLRAPRCVDDSAGRRLIRRCQIVAISMITHPDGASKMRGPDCLCPIRIHRGVESENERCYLAPVGSVSRGVEEAQIRNPVCPVIVGRLRCLWRRVMKRCGHRFAHWARIFVVTNKLDRANARQSRLWIFARWSDAMSRAFASSAR
jgi:hypothetical protein